MPGSEWLYVKVYTGNKTADRILTEHIKPLTEQWLAEGLIDKWFFIRYHDPEPHLRLRFHHASRKDFWVTVLTQLHAALDPLLQNGMVAKVLTDTYQREIERYGARTMTLSEDLFCADSVAVAGFLDLIEGDEGERYRWLFALRNVDTLLDDFGLDLEAKDRLMRGLQNWFYAEFNKQNKTSRLLHSLNDKYRAETRAIESILGPQPETSPLQPGLDCFRRRSERNRRLVADLEQLRNTSPATTPTNEALLSSYIHMTLNRTFIARQRMHELVIYHYLSRYYESSLARRKAAGKRPEKDLAALAAHP
jgi:thiopeptide-type bacteriocin biosynthesis protein